MKDEINWLGIAAGAPTADSCKDYSVKKRIRFLTSCTSVQGKKILDVGCGTGAYLISLKQDAEYVVGIDVERKHLRKGKKDKIELVCGVAESLPFKHDVFDLVMLIEVTEHLRQVKHALTEISRVLNTRGMIFVTVPNKLYPLETHGMRICGKHIRNLFSLGIPFLSWSPHFLRRHLERARIYSENEIVNLLGENGFQSFRTKYIMPSVSSLEKRPKCLITFTIALRKTFEKMEGIPIINFLGDSIMVLAHKIIQPETS